VDLVIEDPFPIEEALNEQEKDRVQGVADMSSQLLGQN
jgi:hypothetical protein